MVQAKIDGDNRCLWCLPVMVGYEYYFLLLIQNQVSKIQKRKYGSLQHHPE